jgi:hypothetical protein
MNIIEKGFFMVYYLDRITKGYVIQRADQEPWAPQNTTHLIEETSSFQQSPGKKYWCFEVTDGVIYCLGLFAEAKDGKTIGPIERNDFHNVTADLIEEFQSQQMLA